VAATAKPAATTPAKKAAAKKKAKKKSPAKKPAATKPAPAPTAGGPSHLELGVALHEQGQPQRAIEELHRALKQGDRKVRCYTLIGLCYVDLGITAKAISAFKNALFQEDATVQESTALRYELGRAHERQEEWEEALYYYRRVFKEDPAFRDTAIRIKAIGQA
jgi:tetratricopeptide (TPR) repeat protein